VAVSLAMLSEMFIQSGYFFEELCKKTKVDAFFLNKVYIEIDLIAHIVSMSL